MFIENLAQSQPSVTRRATIAVPSSKPLSALR